MRCIFIFDEHFDVKTYWGWFRLDRGAYEDYLKGKLWITWVPARSRQQVETDRKGMPLPPDITSEAIRLRDLAAKQGVYTTLQNAFPGIQTEIPYRQRMRDKTIDELSLSVRSSNGLMRANAGTFGRLWDLLLQDNGLRTVRNLGAKSEVEIKRSFLDGCYSNLSSGEQAVFWQKIINSIAQNS